jgi:hypothetical protein
MTLLPSSIEGLMGLWEEQPVSPSLKGLELGNESSLFMWGSSDAPYCPLNERCIPESMVGTMSPWEGTLALERRGDVSSVNNGDKLFNPSFVNGWLNLANLHFDA